MYNELCGVVVKVQVIGMGASDTFGLHLLKRRQGKSRRKDAMCWNRCVKKHVISKHYVLVMNNIQMFHDFNQIQIFKQINGPKINANIKFKLILRLFKYVDMR